MCQWYNCFYIVLFFSENRKVISFMIENNKIFAILIIFHFIDEWFFISWHMLSYLQKLIAYDKGLTLKHRNWVTYFGCVWTFKNSFLKLHRTVHFAKYHHKEKNHCVGSWYVPQNSQFVFECCIVAKSTHFRYWKTNFECCWKMFMATAIM